MFFCSVDKIEWIFCILLLLSDGVDLTKQSCLHVFKEKHHSIPAAGGTEDVDKHIDDVDQPVPKNLLSGNGLRVNILPLPCVNKDCGKSREPRPVGDPFNDVDW